MRFYSQCKGDKKKEDSLNGSYFIVFCIFAIIAFIAGIILTVNTKFLLGTKLTANELDLAQKLMFIMAINMAISFPISVFSAIVTSRECFIFQKIVELLKSVFNPILVIFALLLGHGSIGLVLVSTVLTVIAAGINIWYVLVKINAGFDFNNFNMKLMKEVGAFSFFIFLNSIIDQINWNVVKFLLGRFVGSIYIALYSLDHGVLLAVAIAALVLGVEIGQHLLQDLLGHLAGGHLDADFKVLAQIAHIQEVFKLPPLPKDALLVQQLVALLGLAFLDVVHNLEF